MLTSTAGHELFHMIKNLAAEYAEDFTAFVIDHLKEAGQYESVFNDYARRYGRAYANDESFKAKIDEEIVADHCFEAMTNKEQWDSFAAENKTLAEKIKDFILEFVAMINRAYDKYFAHDNAEIRNEVLGEIDYMNEIAKRLWEGVDEAVENYRFGAGTESETKFSINEIVDDDGNKYGIGVVLDSNLLEGLNQNERKQMVKERVVGELAGQQVIAYDKSGNAVEINFAQKGDKFKNKNGKNASVLKELYHKNIDKSIKQEAVVLADELVESAKYRESEKAKYSHDWLDNNGKNNWDYWDVYIQDKNKTVYVATLNVANTQNGIKILYDIDPIKKARGPMKSGPTITNINISQNDKDVNTHSMQNSKNNSSFSISDADYLAAAESGDEKTAAEMVKKAVEEAFKDSVIRDDDGNLLKVYHGRVSEFNIFDREFASIEGDMGKGFYFSSQEDDVDSNYANVEGPDLTNKIARLAERIEAEQDIDYDEAEKKAREQYIKSEPNTVEAYLNVKNPAIISNDSDGTYLEYNENYDEETDDYGDPEGSLVDFVEALESAAEDYESFGPVNFWEALGDSIYDGGISLKDAIPLLKENIFDDLSDENGDLAINEVIRQAIEDIGFDGIIDKTVSEKFTNMQGMYSDTTHYIVFDSSQIKSADPITYDNDGNIIPLSERFNENEKDIRYSIADEERYNSLQKEYQELVTKSNEIKNSPEFEKLVDAISTKSGDALDEAIKEYGRFTHKSGLYAASKRMSEIIGEQKELRSRIDNDNAQSRDQFMKSVDNLSEKEKAEYVKNAEETFGTTDNVRLASYLLIDGEMLDFSEGQGYRVRDHREISEILDMPDSAEYSDSLIYFMNMGNIRMQTYGIDISAAPNAEQISRLRDVIPEIMKDNDEFSVDFSKKNGYSAGSVTYPKGTATSKILSDINEFFESGTVPVYESEYGEFRYSVSESFEDQIDSVLNNTFDKNNHIYMGNTPYSLQSILHLQNKPMLITPTHVYTMTVSKAQAKVDGRYSSGDNYHDLGKELLLKLPKALEKPMFLIKSTAKPDDLRVVAVTSLTDKNGVNVVAAIKPDGVGPYWDINIDSNIVLSGYGKSNVLNYVLNAKKEGRILYASEKNNRLGKSNPGVQFPGTTFTADYSNSLSQYRETVNKYYAQNDKEYLSNSNKYKSFELSDEVKASISDAGMRLTDDAELSSLMRSNADYKAEIERLKGEFVKSKRMGGKGANRLVQTDINRIARNIIGEYSSGISFFDLKDELTGLYGFIANSEKNSWDYAYAVQAANNIAKSVIAQSFVNITPETFESYKKELRSHRLIPSLDDVAEMTAMFGTFGAAYRQYGKKLNMRAQGTENAVHIDEIWDDLCAAVIRDVLYIFQSPTRPRLPNTSFLQSSSGPLFAAAYG